MSCPQQNEYREMAQYWMSFTIKIKIYSKT